MPTFIWEGIYEFTVKHLFTQANNYKKIKWQGKWNVLRKNVGV